MIVNMSEKASAQEIDHVIERVKELGFQAHVTRGVERTIIAAVGNSTRRSELEALQAAAASAPSSQSAPCKLERQRPWSSQGHVRWNQRNRSSPPHTL